MLALEEHRRTTRRTWSGSCGTRSREAWSRCACSGSGPCFSSSTRGDSSASPAMASPSLLAPDDPRGDVGPSEARLLDLVDGRLADYKGDGGCAGRVVAGHLSRSHRAASTRCCHELRGGEPREAWSEQGFSLPTAITVSRQGAFYRALSPIPRSVRGPHEPTRALVQVVPPPTDLQTRSRCTGRRPKPCGTRRGERWWRPRPPRRSQRPSSSRRSSSARARLAGGPERIEGRVVELPASGGPCPADTPPAVYASRMAAVQTLEVPAAQA